MSGSSSDLDDPMRLGTHNGHLMVSALRSGTGTSQ